MMKTGETILCTAAAVLTLLGVGVRLVPGMIFTTYICFGIALGCLAWVMLSRWAETSRRWKTVRRFFAAGCVILACLLTASETSVIVYALRDRSDVPADAVIILGAGVNGKTPSLALQSRLDRAVDYMTHHPEIPVVLSGGQGPGEDIPEADAMYQYFVTRYPEWETRLILENRATSTAENLRYSRALLEESGVPSGVTVAVITNDFHMRRTALIAGRMGLETVEIGAPLPWWWLTFNYYAREAFAIYKTLVFDR